MLLFCSSQPHRPTTDPRATAIVAIVALLLVAAAALAWSTRYLPGTDGPNHLITAWIFRDLMWNPGSLNGKFYQFRPDFFTTFGTEAVGWVAIPILGPLATEKLLFTVAIVGVPAAIIAGIYAAAGRMSPFMVLALPYGYTQTLADGNFNYLLGLILQLGILAAILGQHRLPNGRMTAAIAICGVALALTHPAPTVLLLFLAGTLVLGRSIRLWSDDRPAALRMIVVYAAAVLPMIAVLVLFLIFSPASSMAYQRPAYLRLREFLIQYELYKLGRHELFLAMALSAMMIATAVTAVRARWTWKFHDRDWLLVLSFASFVLYMISPNKMSGGDAFVARIEILPWILLLMWLAVQPLPGWVGTGILATGTLLQCAFLAGAYHTHAIANKDIKRYFELAAAIPRDTIVVPVIGDTRALDPTGWAIALRARPFDHLYNVVAIQNGTVFLKNWNAHFRISNVQFRPELDPYPDLWSGDLAAGLERYERRTDVHPDGILIWRLARDSREWAELKPLLEARYQLALEMSGGRTISAYYRRVVH
jgi:hypothetical protein